MRALVKIVIFVALGCSSSLYAQMGLKVGLNVANLSQDDLDYTSNKSAIYYQVGLTTPLNREEPAFRAEFLFSVKGRVLNSENTVLTSYGSHTYKSTQKDYIPYFDMPLLFTFPVHDRFILEGGPNVAVRLGGKRTTSSTITFQDQQGAVLYVHNYDEQEYKYSDKNAFPNNREYQPDEEDKLSKNLIRRFDVGLNIGFQVFVLEKLTVLARYNFGLIDVISDKYYNLDTNNPSYDAHRNLEVGFTLFFGE